MDSTLFRNCKLLKKMKKAKLAKEMKKKYCNKQGKETNPVEAAEIIHKIRLI